ncbi:MAG: alpha/beta hydrolase [Actinomycetota bacterium]|nr:alpha/beta hydrolase [Actinomycetota bacterium]
MTFDAFDIDLHGHPMVYRRTGSGPPVVLVHGMVNSSRHWEKVALALADRYTVIAPDLIGHGDSAGPRGDYSLGAHASRIRDLLTAIGVDSATLVGHSYGGGVAMQFFWQFPQRTERLALISSGGLGPEVSPALRSAALPGASALLSLVAHRRLVAALAAGGDRLRERGAGAGVYLQALSRAMHPLTSPGARHAFLQTLRSVIDGHGQRVAANDRLYLLGHAPTPTLIVWGGRDNTIPIAHGRAAHQAVPSSRFEVLDRAAHFPHLEDPAGLARVLAGFFETTEGAPIPDSDWGQVIGGRSAPKKATRASGANQTT